MGQNKLAKQTSNIIITCAGKNTQVTTHTYPQREGILFAGLHLPHHRQLPGGGIDGEFVPPVVGHVVDAVLHLRVGTGVDVLGGDLGRKVKRMK